MPGRGRPSASCRRRDFGYLAIRGREQQLIDYNGRLRFTPGPGHQTFVGAALSDQRNPALTENSIRGVGKDNPFGPAFHGAASLAFGEMTPYTGNSLTP